MKNTCSVILLILLCRGLLPAQTPVLVVPTGHSSYVNSFMASADGNYFLTLGGEGLIKLWNKDGKELRTIRTADYQYSEAQLSPDNQHILAFDKLGNKDAWVLDIASGAQIFTLDGHSAPLWCATYSPDGTMIATCSKDSTAILWDARNGALRYRFSGNLGAVVSTFFSPDGKLLATLAWDRDKTVRIWETATGKLLHEFKTNGKLPSTGAFSPDGKTLAIVADGQNPSIALWSVESGEKTRDLDGYLLRFSPDGQWIAVFQDNAAHLYRSSQLDGKPVRTLQATLAPSDQFTVNSALSGYFMPDSKSMLINANYGVPEVYNIETGRLKLRLKGYALPVQCATFSPDATKIIVGSNSDVQEWDLTQGSLTKHIQGTQGKIEQAQFVPDGKKIITVTEEYTGAIWDADSSKVVTPLEATYVLMPGIPYENFPGIPYAGVLAVSPNGQSFVRGHPIGSEHPPFLSTWSVSDGSRLDSIFVSNEYRAQDAAFSTDGKLVAMAASGGLLVWDLAARKWKKLAENINYDDYTSVAFLDEKRFAAGTTSGKLEFWDARKKEMIAQDSIPDAYVHDITCSPDRRWIAAAVGNRSIGLWRCDPNEPLQFVDFFEGHDNEVSSVEFSPDSRLLLSSSLDHTVRIWDVEKKTKVAKLIHLNQNDWAVTTPSGLFDASPGAMELMYFLLGDEIIELEQLKERYYEPGLLAKVMGLASGELRHVDQFKDLALYPKIEANIAQNQLNIKLVARNGGIGKLSLFVNDKEVAEDVNPPRGLNLSLDLITYEKYYRSDTLNSISLRAYNKDGWLKSQAYRIDYPYVRAKGPGGTGDTRTLGDAKARLFALVVGTADYSGKKLDLKYADQDAAAIATAIKAVGKELFGEGVQVQLFTTGNLAGNPAPANNQISSKTNIKNAFEILAGQARATDVLLLYFSGHGITYGEAEKAQFYYLTKDIASEDLSDPDVRTNFTISSNEMTDWIKKIPALKQVLIIDACNSGKIVESLAAIGQKNLNPSQVRALDRMKDRTGMFILTGSANNMVSYEASQYGQGLLTYSLLEGMSGLALSPDKRVDVMTLFQYSRDNVPEMAKSINGIQTPILAFPINGGSFDIGIVNENVKIPLAQVKPVFIRNNFLDEETISDELGLTDALEENFRKITVRGGQSQILFVDVKAYENAYSMKGLYHVAGNAVQVRVRLFKGKTLVGEEFNVRGTKDDVPGLVNSILEQVLERLK